MDAKAEVERLLHAHRAVLLRQKKHRIWRLLDGRKWTTPKSPSDSAAWQNNLGELRLALGLKASDKTHADFEHKKKEAHKKTVETPKKFLGDIPEREERPAVPVSPSPLLPEPVQEPEREMVTLYGRVPGDRRQGYRRETEKHGQVFTYSPEVMSRANFILETQGDKAMATYLHDVRSGRANANANGSEPEQPTAETKTGDKTSGVFAGPLEAAVQAKREEILIYKRKEEEFRLKRIKAETVLRGLEAVLETERAALSSFKESTSAPVPKKGDKHPRGFWKREIALALTDPQSKTRHQLLDALCATHPEDARDVIYQSIFNGLKMGWLLEETIAGTKFVRFDESKGGPMLGETE